MKAIVQDQYGGPDVLHLEDIDTPTVDSGEVLLRVQAASLFAGDWHFMAGMPLAFRPASGLMKPKIRVRGRGRRGSCRSGRSRRQHVPYRRRCLRDLQRRVRGLRDRHGQEAGSEAGEPHIRGGGRRPDHGHDGSSSGPRSREGSSRTDGPRHRCRRRCRIVRRPDREGVWRRRDGRMQHDADRLGAIDRRRRRHRLHPRGLRGVGDPIRRDPRHGWEPPAVGSAARARVSGTLVIVGGEGGKGKLLGGFTRGTVRAPLVSMFTSQTMKGFVAKENAGDLVALKDLIEAGKVTALIDRTFSLEDVLKR